MILGAGLSLARAAAVTRVRPPLTSTRASRTPRGPAGRSASGTTTTAMEASTYGEHSVHFASGGQTDADAAVAAAVARAGVSVDAMHEADVHALVRGLDADGDGLLSLDEWAAAFPGLPDSEAARPNPNPDPSPRPNPSPNPDPDPNSSPNLTLTWP